EVDRVSPGVVLAGESDVELRLLNIYEWKLPQSRRFISCSESCSSAQEAIPPHMLFWMFVDPSQTGLTVCHSWTSGP
ncbi:hypothetical protein GOODEAATRI_030409, partial [Goodea atripinnis]